MRLKIFFLAMACMFSLCVVGAVAQDDPPVADDTAEFVLGQDADEVTVDGETYTADKLAASATKYIIIRGRPIITVIRPGIIVIRCVRPYNRICVIIRLRAVVGTDEAAAQ